MDSSDLEIKDIQNLKLQACLKKMKASPVFISAQRQFKFLDYLVNHTISGESNRLKGYTIGVEVFNRGEDFDPSIDAIVRVEAGKLRAKLREYYAEHGQKDEVVFKMSKGNYAIKIEFLEAKSEPSLSNDESNHYSGKFDQTTSLAVLPFGNFSTTGAQDDYLVEGLADSIIFMLSRLKGLFVIGRQSSFAYRNTKLTSNEIGAALGVQYLMEGNVQYCNGKLRVTIKLVEASSEVQIWSERFDGVVDDIFALQDQITLSALKILEVKISGNEAEIFGQQDTNSIEAHDFLLRGLECHWKYTPHYIGEARKYFAKAIVCDSEYAAAHAWLARSMIHQWIMKWDDMPGLEDLAMKHARQAVLLNPKLPYAIAILGWVNLWHKCQEHSIAYSRQAVALDQNNAELLIILSMALSSAGFGEEAMVYIEKAKRINPYSSPFYEFVLGQAYFVLKDYDKAIAAYLKGCKLSNSFIPNHVYLCIVYALLENDFAMHAKREEVLSLLGGDKTRMIHSPWTDNNLSDLYEELLQKASLV